ncbi:unnamed protein product [Prorocentrum cordatum]|uniref:Uncharacterized protein n=1 Tax=Prorocentrum cordatum TaxID=2364126 RepID=A0ABN9WJE1_9DINO|nr:unnamed protein product [Polarella glacialis]
MEARRWAASSARTLARRLRRQRREELGGTRASALANRVQTLRVALAEHWRLGDVLGCHFPTMAEALEAARVVGLPQECLQTAEEALGAGNWARHAGPPNAARRPPPMPSGTSADFLEKVLKVQSFPLNADAVAYCCWAPGDWSRAVQEGLYEEGDADAVVEEGAEQAYTKSDVDIQCVGAEQAAVKVAKADVGAVQEGRLMVNGGRSGANLAEGTGEAGAPAYAVCDSEAGLEGGVEEMSIDKEAGVAMQRGWWAARARVSRAWLGTKASESKDMAELEAQGVEGFAASEGKGIDEQKVRCLLTGKEMSNEKEAGVAMQRGWWAARARISRAWLGTKASESNDLAELEAQGVEGFAASEGKGIDTQNVRCLLTGKVSE